MKLLRLILIIALAGMPMKAETISFKFVGASEATEFETDSTKIPASSILERDGDKLYIKAGAFFTNEDYSILTMRYGDAIDILTVVEINSPAYFLNEYLKNYNDYYCDFDQLFGVKNQALHNIYDMKRQSRLQLLYMQDKGQCGLSFANIPADEFAEIKKLHKAKMEQEAKFDAIRKRDNEYFEKWKKRERKKLKKKPAK